MSAASEPLCGLRRRVAGIAVLNRFTIALCAPTAPTRAGAARHAHRPRQPSRLLSPRRSHSRTPFSPTTMDRVRRCDRFATPSQLALSIAPCDSYNTPRKPRDGSGAVPLAALRTPPLRRRSANPLKYQWLSLPVAWTTRKHIDDAGGRDYLTPDAARCPELYIHVFIAVSSVFADTSRHEYPGTSECSLNARFPWSESPSGGHF